MRPSNPDSKELHIPLRRQLLDTGLEYNFHAQDAGETETNLLTLSLALARVRSSDGLAGAARITAYALGRFADRQKFGSLPPIAQNVLRTVHPLHPRASSVIRARSEILLNEAHRFVSGYMKNSASGRIYDLALIVLDEIEFIAHDVLGVWLNWFGMDNRFKPVPYWRETSTTPAPVQSPAPVGKWRYLEPATLVIVGMLGAWFLLKSCELAHLWRVLGCILSVLCVAAAPVRLYICHSRRAATVPQKAG